MATNLERFSEDLDELIRRGELLRFSMLRSISKDDFDKQIESQFGKKNADVHLKKLPNFKVEYEAWYSESLALLRQLLPDRADNFISLYEKPKSRKEIAYGNYVIQDYLQGLRVTNFGGEVKVDSSAAVPQFDQQLAILKAAKSRFKSSLFEIRQLVQADLFDGEMGAARGLHKEKFYRAAGVLAGVVLERHLRQVCEDRKIEIKKKHPTLSELSELLKSSGTIDVPQWRFLSLLADIRNICAHDKQKEPTSGQVADLLDGTDKVIKTIV